MKASEARYIPNAKKKQRKLFCREWFSATVIFQELASLQQLYLPSTEDCPIILRYLHKGKVHRKKRKKKQTNVCFALTPTYVQ